MYYLHQGDSAAGAFSNGQHACIASPAHGKRAHERLLLELTYREHSSSTARWERSSSSPQATFALLSKIRAKRGSPQQGGARHMCGTLGGVQCLCNGRMLLDSRPCNRWVHACIVWLSGGKLPAFGASLCAGTFAGARARAVGGGGLGHTRLKHCLRPTTSDQQPYLPAALSYGSWASAARQGRAGHRWLASSAYRRLGWRRNAACRRVVIGRQGRRSRRLWRRRRRCLRVGSRTAAPALASLHRRTKK